MRSWFHRPSVPAYDWFAQATPEQIREYNAFGPWIYEIKHREDMPRCFLPWYNEVDKAPILLKVPVNRDRRDARPGQDLYRALVAVDPIRLVLLTLEPTGRVECRVVPLNQVWA